MDEEKILCDRCGEVMLKTQRCCLKCGKLNYLLEENNSMVKFAPKDDTKYNTYILEKGVPVASVFSKKKYVYADKAGSRTICILVNILFLVISILGICFAFSSNYENAVDILFSTEFNIMLIILIISFIEILGFQFVYMKTNKPWWNVFIPFYNNYVYFNITMGSGWIFLLLFIPIVNIVVLLISFYNLGEKFNKERILTLLFPFIYIPLIGFSTTSFYKEVYYVNEKNESGLSKIDRSNKALLGVFSIVVCFSLGIIIYNNLDYVNKVYNHVKYRVFIRDTKQIIVDFKNNLKVDGYKCSSGSIGRDSEIGTYYVKFDDAGKYFNSNKVTTSAISDNVYRGYIKIENLKGKKTIYSIAINDGEVGISEVVEKEINKTIVSNKYDVEIPDDAVICEKK